MSEQKEKVFAKGIFVEKPSQNAPDFVIAKVSFRATEACLFIMDNANNAGYTNLDILMAKDGQKYYAALNQFEPKKPESLQDTSEEDGSSSIPF